MAFLRAFVCSKRALTASTVTVNRGRTLFERVMGHTPDIGTFYMFGWYNFVYYKEQDDYETRQAIWLGPAPDHGDGSCHWILPISYSPLVRG